MASYDELSERMRDVGGRDLAPIVEELASRLGLDGDDRQAAADALAKAWLAGMHAGVVETVAQAQEAGVELRLNVLGGPADDPAAGGGSP